MKNLLCILFIAFSFAGFSQTVNDVPLEDIDVEYVQIVGTGKLFSTKVTIEIDFGQEDKIFKTKDTRILDENGKDVVLNSMIDALNFMNAHGYSFVTAYTLTIANQNVYHFILKKN